MDSRPKALDLFCGLGGWAQGFLAEGYHVIGFDIERQPYPGQLVIQDVLTLHGSQLRHADAIVASPPCQAYSYRAMPWKRARAKVPLSGQEPAWWDKPEKEMSVQELEEWERWQWDHPLLPPSTALFNACFRLQQEACAAAGRYIPMVVENVCGAQKWVGRARWRYGSFFLWGDVPALMPFANRAHHKIESPHLWLRDPKRANGKYAPAYTKNGQFKGFGGSWFAQNHNTNSGSKGNPIDGTGHDPESMTRRFSSRSDSRKAASAQIAMIPYPLARWIARCFKPASYTEFIGRQILEALR